MKKVLYYAIRPGMYGGDIVAVTSEKRRHWYGRTVTDDVGTHGRSGSIQGRFDSLEEAQSRLELVQAAHHHYEKMGAELSRAHSALYHAREAMMRRIITGVRQRGDKLVEVDVVLSRREEPERLPDSTEHQHLERLLRVRT